MADKGKMLLVAVESDFQQTTVEALHDEGYACDVAPAAAPALALLRSNRYDVLLAEIEVPGNTSLELIHEISRSAERPSVVLVADVPSVSTAVESIHLPVLAYLIKPVKFDDLLGLVCLGIERSKTRRAVVHLQGLVRAWYQELEVVEGTFSSPSRQSFCDPVNVFMQSTFHRIVSAQTELFNLFTMLADHRKVGQRRIQFSDPRVDLLRDALTDTVAVLEKTKHAFKSKDLGVLRKHLERVITESKKDIVRSPGLYSG